MVAQEVRATLFDGCFRQAVIRGQVDVADRDAWREVFIERPDDFDFVIAHRWRAAA
jgi:hypothetical protein